MVGSTYLFIRSLIGRNVKYDILYTLIKNEYNFAKLSHVLKESVKLNVAFYMSPGLVCSFPNVRELLTSSEICEIGILL